MLKNLMDSFHQAIDKNSSNDGFENISKDFAWLKQIYVSVVDFEIFLERVADEEIDLLFFGSLLGNLLLFPIHKICCIFLMTARFLLFVQDVLLETEQTYEFGKKFVFG